MEQTAPVKSKLEVFDILAKLESLTGSATKLPLTNRAVLNPADLNELIGALKRGLPAEVTEAQQIIRFKESILGQAHNEAKRIRATAEEESLNKVSETQVSRDSKIMAERLVAEAREQAREVLSQAEDIASQRVQGADEYAAEVLGKLEGELNGLLATARRGLETLAQNRDTPPNGVTDPAN